MDFRNKRGSITIFVLVGLLFMTSFLIISFSSNVNRSKVIEEQKNIISSIYNEGIKDINPEIYIVEINIPDNIFTNIKEENEYVNIGVVGRIIEYNVFGETFNSIAEVKKYVINNNRHNEEVEIIVKVKDNNKVIKEEAKKVTFREQLDPIINELPSLIITNSKQENTTPIVNSYTEFDSLGGTTEFIVFGEKFNTLKEVEQYVNANNKYEKNNITINAYGNSGKTTSITKEIEFRRGMIINDEENLVKALATTEEYYILINNNIECANTISVDGVTHTLDLNNKTISKTVTSGDFTLLTLGSNTNLTVMDSSSDKQGTIVAKLSEEAVSDGNNRESTIIGIDNQGVLNIESGVVIAADMSEIITAGTKTDGVGVHVKGIAMQNSGTINLNGGTVSSNVVTQSCSRMSIQISEARATAIVNQGTINVTSGYINTDAQAYAVRESGAWMYGRTQAYAYGVENSGTINNSENITFSTTATAHKENTYGISNTEKAKDIIKQ